MKTQDTTAAMLEAGAILLPGSTGRADADTLTVRTYAHPVLGDRPVVRLVPGTLGEAEDLALDFLGLARAPEAPEVGQVRRETLGFPAWALVNDPANGHHALALVKDIERLARQAKSRAGAAKDGFEALASRLDRAVPHFLPTFYEQAARIFLQHDNTTYAATFFGKARAAERVHSLAVDEERLRSVFLEFAFAGALTVKALKEHVRDLTRRLGPVPAWAQFRQLTAERCGAGLPPYASLPQDARSLLKAAGLDRVSEECSLLADLLASPAVVRAPASFWTAYRPALVLLAQQRPAVRARLLEIMPAGNGADLAADESWLSLLAETGAESLLTAWEAAEGVDPADWLGRWATHRKHGSSSSDRSPATLALVGRMAPRLLADGRPVDLFQGRWHAGADIDLLDACLAAGIPLSRPASDVPVHLPLDRWLVDGQTPGRRDLTATAADPGFTPLLRNAVGGLGTHRLGEPQLEAVAAHPVLRSLLHDWLQARAEEFVRASGMPGARAALQRLGPFRGVAAKVNPAAVARVAEHDLSPLLARTLRAGILDELGWPALEDALRALDADAAPAERNDWFAVSEAWPALILARRHKAVVVGPDKVLLEHDLRLPSSISSWQRPHFRFTDGELLVIWWEDGKQRAYWSARPAEVFTLGGEQLSHGWRSNQPGPPSLPLPGGGRVTGGRTLHAGDTALPSSRPVLCDGTGYWREARQEGKTVWAEYDPATGTHGRASLPGFLRSAVREDTRLRPELCEVLPVQPGLEHSPFGTDGAILGRWVRTGGEGTGEWTTAGSPDGRTVTLPAVVDGRRPVPLGALRMPGGAAPVAALSHHGVSLYPEGAAACDGALGSVVLNDRGKDFAAGTRLVPPVAFWHALRPRDERGSAALRALTDATAGALLHTVVAQLAERQAEAAKHRQYTGPTSGELVRAAVATTLPALSHPDLLTGAAGIVEAAADLAAAAARFVAPVAPNPRHKRQHIEGMFCDHRPENGHDALISQALGGIAHSRSYGWWGGEPKWTVLQQIRALNHVLSGKPADGQALPAPEELRAVGPDWRSDERIIPGIGTAWLSALDALHPLAYRAVSPLTPDDERQALLLLLEELAAGPLADAGGCLREVVLSEQGTEQRRIGQVLRQGPRRTVAIVGCRRVDLEEGRVHWLALDHDPDGGGRSGPVAHFTIHEENHHGPAFPADRLTALARLVREKGVPSWRPAAATALAGATGLGPAQTALLLAGLPNQPSAGQLAVLGLKARQVPLAQGLLGSLSQADRLALLSSLLPADPADLWESGPDTGAAGRVWDERLGSVVRLPEDLVAELPGAQYTAVLNPQRTAWLSRTTVQRPGKNGSLVPDDPEALPDRSQLAGAAATLAGLAYWLPYGHPLRAVLPAGLAAVRQRLADPGLLLGLGIEWTDKGGPTAVQLRKAYGLPESGGADADGLTRVGESLVLRPWYSHSEMTLVRPAGLTGADDPVFGLIEGLVGERAGALAAVRAILGDDLSRAVHAGLGPDAPEGYAQDPGRSAPELVAEAAAAHGLSDDAAVLYLQLLALPDPTDRNCARWTGWKPARLKRARTELAGTGLVIEAKRARAGRALFLPCGWRELKAPALPVEIWKEGLYPVRGYERAVPVLPVPELFHRAWQRVREGDAPGFEQLTTRATRKGHR